MISNTSFITSASCFFPRRHQEKTLQVKTGHHKGTSEVEEITEFIENVSTIIHHHWYDYAENSENATKFNIAIAFTKSEILLNPHTRPICYTHTGTAARNYIQTNYHLFGQAEQEVLERTNYCAHPFICAKPTNDKGKCVADVGSPIVQKNSDESYPQMVGIIADKEEYCETGKGSFIRLSDPKIVEL